MSGVYIACTVNALVSLIGIAIAVSALNKSNGNANDIHELLCSQIGGRHLSANGHFRSANEVGQAEASINDNSIRILTDALREQKSVEIEGLSGLVLPIDPNAELATSASVPRNDSSVIARPNDYILTVCKGIVSREQSVGFTREMATTPTVILAITHWHGASFERTVLSATARGVVLKALAPPAARVVVHCGVSQLHDSHIAADTGTALILLNDDRFAVTCMIVGSCQLRVLLPVWAPVACFTGNPNETSVGVAYCLNQRLYYIERDLETNWTKPVMISRQSLAVRSLAGRPGNMAVGVAADDYGGTFALTDNMWSEYPAVVGNHANCFAASVGLKKDSVLLSDNGHQMTLRDTPETELSTTCDFPSQNAPLIPGASLSVFYGAGGPKSTDYLVLNQGNVEHWHRESSGGSMSKVGTLFKNVLGFRVQYFPADFVYSAVVHNMDNTLQLYTAGTFQGFIAIQDAGGVVLTREYENIQNYQLLTVGEVLLQADSQLSVRRDSPWVALTHITASI